LVAGVLAVAAVAAAAATGAFGGNGNGADQLGKINHFVVIYEENHSFDNLYGGWEGVNGPANADSAHTTQVNQAGVPFQCLYQDDVNLQAQSSANPNAPLTTTCTDTTTATPFPSHFVNAPFAIDDYLAPTDTTCPPTPLVAFSSPNGFKKGTGSPGGCTRDIVHRFYQEQFQLNGGQQNRYMLGSDAGGLVMGTYETKSLPVYEYLHGHPHQSYAIADDFFQAAFGGSFLNHQWLIAAATPTFPGAAPELHSVVDANGMPTSYPLYASPLGSAAKDTALTALCGATTPPNLGCGDYAVNTIQPAVQPFSSPTALKLPLQTAPTIGDRLSAKGIDWAWYSGGWSNADGDVGAPGWTNGTTPGTCTDPNTATGSVYPNCPGKLFQFHHQPFNYFAAYAPGQPGRAHLRDEAEFQAAAAASKHRCRLKPVSIVKPYGTENEHPGYSSESNGSDHLVDLLSSIQHSRCAKDTMVVVTYDEFGGQWDHVSPPGQGGTPGPHDNMGPGTRIPALVLAPRLHGDFVVDHVQHDTTSIMATIEHRFGLSPVSKRDAAVHDLSSVFKARPPRHHGH
jgi:phospholipase C